MWLTVNQLQKKVGKFQDLHTPIKTKIDKEAIEISDWIECKINELEKEGLKGCYISNILPNHLATSRNLKAIDYGYLDEGL